MDADATSGLADSTAEFEQASAQGFTLPRLRQMWPESGGSSGELQRGLGVHVRGLTWGETREKQSPTSSDTPNTGDDRGHEVVV